jgi:type III secretory pathway component EscR
MPLKWSAVVMATVAVTLCVTANILVEVLSTQQVPIVVNLFAVALASVMTLVAVMAEFYQRVNDRLSAMSEFIVVRLAELDDRTGDRNTGFVEGYLLGQGHDDHPLGHSSDASVVPLGFRSGRRAMSGSDD